MGLTCGLVGVAGCGKTTIFNAITGASASGFDGAEMHAAVVSVPDPRIDQLAAIYQPQKTIYATLKIVDIPGLQSDTDTQAKRTIRLLAHIKDVDALLHVVRCFDAGEPVNPVRDVENIDIELMVADSQTLQNKRDRLIKKARIGDKSSQKQVEDCEKVKAALETGVPARRQQLSVGELESVAECNLVSLKPVLYIANIGAMEAADSEPVKILHKLAEADGTEAIIVSGRDEADITALDEAEKKEFMADLGITESSVNRLLPAAYHLLGLIDFFTVGPDEVRAWTCCRSDKAPVAAGKIHTDMEKGFIRMETMKCADLLELGNEAAVVKAGKQRVEGKAYEVCDGDIVTVLFNK
ncbi:redox-regulated ATPase YchF [Chloroflexota bacterium]